MIHQPPNIRTRNSVIALGFSIYSSMPKSIPYVLFHARLELVSVSRGRGEVSELAVFYFFDSLVTNPKKKSPWITKVGTSSFPFVTARHQVDADLEPFNP